MQLFIQHKLDKPLILPIAYNQVIQGIIYKNLMEDPYYSKFIHDEGYEFYTRSFKLFTFSPLFGRYEIKEKNIIFRDTVTFKISSINPQLILLLKDSLNKKGINYNGQVYGDLKLVVTDETVECDDVMIRMISPICLYRSVGNYTNYYSPEDDEFYTLLNDNFYRKYYSYYGIYPDSPICLESISNYEKKYITKFKGIYISGYKGEYRLTGERKYLDFLFQVGLGSKNSQGFGLFDILD